jgi:D-amino peptidase
MVKNMKIYVVCDLEGTAGVADHRLQCQWEAESFVAFNGEYYKQARKFATLELNAVVEGALEGGAKEIVAWDGHGSFPGGLDVELLHPECKLVMTAGDGGPVGLDSSYDALFLCGLHAMAGVEKGVMAHSFWGGIDEVVINGIKVGEVGINCALAGSYGVPTVFISGDKDGIEEAQALVPNIVTATVKEGLVPAKKRLAKIPTLSLSPQKARKIIKKKAKEAMGKISKIEPYVIKPPYTVKTKYEKKDFADWQMKKPNAKRIDDFTVEVKGKSLEEPLF